MDYPVLRNELLADPVALGYAGKTDAQAAALIMATNTGRTLARRSVTKNEILNALVSSEMPATNSAQALKLQIIMMCDTVDASNTNVRNMFGDIFAPGTTTRTNLLALGSRTVSRAEELSLGTVLEVDVQRARSGAW